MVARVHGYVKVLLGNEVPLAHNYVLDPDNDIEANLIRMRNANNQAYGDLILACTDNTSFKIIDTAVSDDLPDGDSALVFPLPQNYWEPDT